MRGQDYNWQFFFKLPELGTSSGFSSGRSVSYWRGVGMPLVVVVAPGGSSRLLISDVRVESKGCGLPQCLRGADAVATQGLLAKFDSRVRGYGLQPLPLSLPLPRSHRAILAVASPAPVVVAGACVGIVEEIARICIMGPAGGLQRLLSLGRGRGGLLLAVGVGAVRVTLTALVRVIRVVVELAHVGATGALRRLWRGRRLMLVAVVGAVRVAAPPVLCVRIVVEVAGVGAFESTVWLLLTSGHLVLAVGTV